MSDTVLVLSGVGLPPYAARGLTQTFAMIDASTVLMRTINGALHDLSRPEFRKYRSTISCTDQRVPALDGVFPGQQVTVDCLFELSYPLGGSPSRPAVEGSAREENGYVFYRPRLIMRVTDYNASQDEYGATVQWTLEVEEI